MWTKSIYCGIRILTLNYNLAQTSVEHIITETVTIPCIVTDTNVITRKNCKISLLFTTVATPALMKCITFFSRSEVKADIVTKQIIHAKVIFTPCVSNLVCHVHQCKCLSNLSLNTVFEDGVGMGNRTNICHDTLL